jgi:hypothetical protein
MPEIGDKVIKTTGDYTFEGTVVSKYNKLSGVTRYVVEDSRGLNLIMNEGQLNK